MRTRPLGLAFLILLPAAAIAQTAAPARIEERLQALLDQHDDALPGISAAIIDSDGQLHTAARGLARKDPAQPMTSAARMFSGSIGKTYCAAVLLQLTAEHQLTLDDRLSERLGARPWFDRLPNAETLTLRHVANHQSGIPEHVWLPEFSAALEAEPARHWRPDDLIAFVLDAEPLFAPGEGWSYADTNYILLGMVIEEVTGRPYEQELRERILEPLGLRDTLPVESPNLPGLISGYTSLAGTFPVPEEVSHDGVYAMNPQFEWTGGGVVSTTADLARFMHAACTGDLLAEPQRLAMLDAVPAKLWPGASYGVGLIRRPTHAGELWGHTGIFPGFLSAAWHHPDSGSTFAVQINADGPEAARALDQLTRALADSLGSPTAPTP